jgi:hypothetical protein
VRSWRVQTGERSELYSPIGLRLLDEMTGDRPIGRVEALLDVRDGAVWRPTGIPAVRTPGGVVAYPGLERRADVTGPPRRYRVRLTADFYRPFYPPRAFDGFRFIAFPWNDTNPPRRIVRMPQDVKLAPSAAYPFPPFVPVLRGRVVDTAGRLVADAEVRFVQGSQVLARVLSDDRGELALPLQLAAFGTRLTIEAEHRPSGLQGILHVLLPRDLGKSQTITIS